MTPRPARSPHIVLVHGAWHDSSCWSEVRRRLDAAGVAHTAVDLPLNGHKHDVATVRAVLDDFEGPKVVVGHSYGGLVISGAAAGRDDIAHLVYVCAFMIDEGTRVLDALMHLEPTPLFDALRITPDGRSAIDPAMAPRVFYNETEEPLAADAAAQLRSMDRNSTTHECLAAPWKTVESTYVLCLRDNAISPEAQRIMATSRAGTIIELDTDHSPFLSRSDELTEIVCSTLA